MLELFLAEPISPGSGTSDCQINLAMRFDSYGDNGLLDITYKGVALSYLFVRLLADPLPKQVVIGLGVEHLSTTGLIHQDLHLCCFIPYVVIRYDLLLTGDRSDERFIWLDLRL